jgi:hypothetical protein
VAELAITGTVHHLNDPGNNPILDLKTASTIHLKPVRPFLSVTQKIDGDLNVDATMSGRLWTVICMIWPQTPSASAARELPFTMETSLQFTGS